MESSTFEGNTFFRQISSVISIVLALDYFQGMVGWLVVLRINVDLAIFQPYLDLEAGDNQSLKIQVARPGIEPRSSCSASQEFKEWRATLYRSATLLEVMETESI